MEAGTGTVVIVAYRPKPGKEADLMQLTREHLPVLRTEGLATDMPATVMMAKDGTIVEVFEWAPGGLEKAHTNAAVGAMWGRYWQACEVVPLNSLAEAAEMFARFTPVIL